MSTTHLYFLSVPGLRVDDVTRDRTPTLWAWSRSGLMAELTPTFPCVTSCVQASMLTGAAPREHGVIANGFYRRDRDEVEFWVGGHDKVRGEFIWDALRRRVPGATSAVWHAQNIKGASADFLVTPAPIHEPDGTTKLWCYSKPDGLYASLLQDLGHFPLQHYWGPLSNIESTKWILRGAEWLTQRHAPNFQFIYVPHLDYAAQKSGPDSPAAQQALVELDQELAAFAGFVADSKVGKNAVFMAAGEYAMTPVKGAVFPNRLLRQAGLLRVREEDGREHIDLRGSAAFAMVDHQLAHVYVRRAADLPRIAELLRTAAGVEGVYAGAQRSAVGMDHDRSGDIVAITRDDRWFAYYWWMDEAAAPPFAKTVDIHRKPGYDPVELFFDPATQGIPLDASRIKGSHGVPAREPRHRTALICSTPKARPEIRGGLRDLTLKPLILRLMS